MNNNYIIWENTILHTIIKEDILAFIIISSEGDVVHANKPFLRIVPDFNKNKLINPSFEKLKTLTPDKNHVIFSSFLTIGDIDSNTNISFQSIIFKKNNQFLIIEKKDSALLIKQNNKLAELSSENIKLQREIIKEKKTLEITLKELEKLNDELNNELQSKDKFFSILAHDLSSPFNNILGFSEILHENIDTLDHDKLKQISEVLYKTSTQTHYLLKNLLDWGMLQRNKQTFQPKKLVLNNIVENTIHLQEENAAQKNIKLTTTLDQQVEVFGDEHMLATIIRNLVSNAIKFTPKNGIITIDAIALQDNIKISIQDNGIGIEEDKIDKIFNGEIESTRGTNMEKGTGLGLSICKEFVEIHKGKIWIESTLNKGTTVSFSLPVVSN